MAALESPLRSSGWTYSGREERLIFFFFLSARTAVAQTSRKEDHGQERGASKTFFFLPVQQSHRPAGRRITGTGAGTTRRARIKAPTNHLLRAAANS